MRLLLIDKEPIRFLLNSKAIIHGFGLISIRAITYDITAWSGYFTVRRVGRRFAETRHKALRNAGVINRAYDELSAESIAMAVAG